MTSGRTIDIGDWLRGFGLGQYEATFRKNEIDESVFAEPDGGGPEELGVAARAPPEAARCYFGSPYECVFASLGMSEDTQAWWADLLGPRPGRAWTRVRNPLSLKRIGVHIRSAWKLSATLKSMTARPPERLRAKIFPAVIYIVAFVTGAIVMSFEMLGSRYLNPYLGSGIYTWAALIATVLGALTAGYFLGGFIADRTVSATVLGAIVTLASL